MKRTIVILLAALGLVLGGCSATAKGEVGGGVQNPIAPAK